nr:hypothetical protein CFP56_16677 [Quercus suber]
MRGFCLCAVGSGIWLAGVGAWTGRGRRSGGGGGAGDPSRQRDGQTFGAVEEEQPGAQRVDHVVEAVGVGHAIDGSVEGKGEDEEVSDVSGSGSQVSDWDEGDAV